VVEGPHITSYPTAVLILLDIDKIAQFVRSTDIESTHISNNMLRIASSCYSYPLCAYYFYWYEDATRSLLNILRGSLNTIRYKLPIVCCNLKYDLKYFVGREAYYFSTHKDRDPPMNYAGQYIIGTATRHLNITLIWSKDVPDPPGLSIVFKNMRTVAPVYFRKTNAQVLFTEGVHMMYCRTKDSKKTDVLSALISPFDWLTWTVLLLVFIAVCLIPGIGVKRALDLVWTILAQPPQTQTFGVFIVALSIVLIPMPNSYTTFFTSNAVKPFERRYIDTHQELFDMGFKMICTGHSIPRAQCVELTIGRFNDSFRKLKLDWSNLEQYILYYNKTDSDYYKPIISKTRDEGANFLNLRHAGVAKALAERDGISECHALTESWFSDSMTLYYAGTYSLVLHRTFGSLIQAGIAEFWNSVIQSDSDTEAKRLSVTRISGSGFHEEEAHMNRSIQSVLIILIFFHLLNIICCSAELLYVQAEARLKRWKTRRQYLKAIWHLGKI